MQASKQIHKIFEQASKIDETLQLKKHTAQQLTDLRTRPQKYSRSVLFKNMAQGVTSLFNGFPTPIKTGDLQNIQTTIIEGIQQSGIDYRIRTKAGNKGNWQYYTVDQLAKKWLRNKAIINVTDFHFRNTPLEQIIDTEILSRFNLFPLSPNEVGWIEMMTIVVSSRNSFSDSHSDDCDGSNHCFTGKKLWLAWETQEGMDAGLEDFDKQTTYDQCSFDIETFTQLKSAHWFTISAGQTLFMPGDFSHKVITLEPYLGTGSFYLAFPNFLRTLTRWLSHQPNWEKIERKGYRDQVYPALIETALKKLHSLKYQSKIEQQSWGLDQFALSIRYWQEQTKQNQKDALRQLPNINPLFHTI